MNKFILTLLTFAGLLTSIRSSAQTDSGYVDLGSTKIKKEYAHQITIKGEDLERMPFLTLKEAINVYLSGTYTNVSSYIYVIDGMQVSDADSYAIHDISTITLVLDARSRVNQYVGSNTNKTVLVLITTKNNALRTPGIMVAGSSHLLKRIFARDGKASTSPDFFHQYYLSGNYATKKMSLGASANFQRNIVPGLEHFTLNNKTPETLNRFRFNAWASWKLGEKNELIARINFVPQKFNSKTGKNTSNGFFGPEIENFEKADQKVFNPSLQLNSRIGKNWNNQLYINYLTTDFSDEKASILSNSSGNQSNELQKFSTQIGSGSQRILIREHIQYSRQINSWTLEPSLDIQFRKNKDDFNSQEKSGPLNSPNLNSLRRLELIYKQQFFSITPALSLYHQNGFSISGGARFDGFPGSDSYYKNNKPEPFISTTVNPVKLIKPDADFNLMLYGSYALTPLAQEPFSNSQIEKRATSSLIFSLNLMYPHSQFHGRGDYSRQLGAIVELFEKQVTLDYNLEESRLSYYMQFNLPGLQGYNPFYSSAKSHITYLTHRIGLIANLATTDKFNWRTGINANTTKSRVKDPENMGNNIYQPGGNTIIIIDPNTGLATELSGSNDPWIIPSTISSNRIWTGGWSNHFSYKKIIAGFNVLHYFEKQKLYRPTSSLNNREVRKYKTLSLQHLYAGYSFPQSKLGAIEVYLSGRNIWQSKKEYYAEGLMKFYGFGFKLTRK